MPRPREEVRAATDRPRRTDRSWLGGTVAVLAAVLGPVALVVGLVDLDGPSRVELTVANPTSWDVSVTLRGPDGDRLPLDVLGRRSGAREYTEVVDLGDRWTFVFSHRGTAVEVPMTRDDLVEVGWQVDVPRSLAERLESEGVAPSP